jgi:hypothetical protein
LPEENDIHFPSDEQGKVRNVKADEVHGHPIMKAVIDKLTGTGW